MLKILRNRLLASPIAISFLFICFSIQVHAQSLGTITTSTDEPGRHIYVNEGPPSSSSSFHSRATASTRTSPLVYWSASEHRFKPVPTSGAVIRAARSAASEVSTYLDNRAQSHQTLNRPYTQQDVDSAIDEAAARHHVDASLVRSVVKVESNFNPNAVSPKGAMGLMQLMPSTARSLNVSNPFDPQQNVDAGVRHLRKLLDSYGGDVQLSLAAYNAGAGAVARSAGVPHFRETQDYVRRITTLYGDASEPLFRHRTVLAARDPVVVRRDSRGVLNISNTD